MTPRRAAARAPAVPRGTPLTKAAQGGPPTKVAADQGEPPTKAAQGGPPTKAARGEPPTKAAQGEPLTKAARGEPLTKAARGEPPIEAPGGEQPPILARLAERVRRRRKELALTVRELSALAGVSERFLVLLEGGRANVSVVRLEDIAQALGTSAAALVSASELEPDERPPAGARGGADGGGGPLVALLGLRGAGKTTIGARAAARLGVPFLELDGLVAARAGMSLAALFEMHGSAYYRRLEREELARLVSARAAGVVATGGGLVTEPTTFELLRRSAVTVWLRARPEDHWSRVVEQGDARPMENRADAMNELRALLRARRALYEQADFVVDTSALGLARSVDRVVRIAREAARRNAARSC